MPKYIVNRDKGYPPDSEVHPFGETFESSDPQAEKDVARGYLIAVEEPREEPKPRKKPAPDTE